LIGLGVWLDQLEELGDKDDTTGSAGVGRGIDGDNGGSGDESLGVKSNAGAEGNRVEEGNEGEEDKGGKEGKGVKEDAGDGCSRKTLPVKRSRNEV
jgi:hypothetical protein